MAKTNNTTTPASKAHTYQVSDATAALLDCIVEANNLYSKITDALALRHDEDTQDAAAQPFLAAVTEITELLHQELQGQVIDGLMDVKNTAAETTII